MRTTHDQGSRRLDVTCAIAREAVSAQMDGEQAPVDVAVHVAACASCADWAQKVQGALRPLRMGTAEATPDLTERILTAIIGTVPRPSFSLTLTRAGLMAVAIVQAVIGIWVLIGSPDHHGEIGVQHMVAESGAWNFAVGIALATAALRPALAGGVVPMVASLVGLLTYAVVRDTSAGVVTTDRILSHGFVAVGFIVLCALAWQMRQHRPERARSVSALSAKVQGRASS